MATKKQAMSSDRKVLPTHFYSVPSEQKVLPVFKKAMATEKRAMSLEQKVLSTYFYSVPSKQKVLSTHFDKIG